MKNFTKEEQEKIRLIYKEIMEMVNDGGIDFDMALGFARDFREITDEIEEALIEIYEEGE